jgi:hypothetical protein
MHAVMSSRGPFMVCDGCYRTLLDDALVNARGWAVNDKISDEFCPNCYDVNRPLIDDLAGSSE